jgi:hypothetical protein
MFLNKPHHTNTMKTIIAGGRDFTRQDEFHSGMTEARKLIEITEVVSGGASGADKMGEAYAAENNIPVKVFPADWTKYGKSAGPRRNMEMALYADALIAFWDGQSRGTKHMIETAQKEGLTIYVHRI